MAVKYFCDICGNEVDKSKARKIIVSSLDYSNSEEIDKDLCDNCQKKLFTFLDGVKEPVYKGGYVNMDPKEEIVCKDESSIYPDVIVSKDMCEEFDLERTIKDLYAACTGINKIARKLDISRAEVKVILKHCGYNMELTDEEQALYDEKYPKVAPVKRFKKKAVMKITDNDLYDRVKRMVDKGYSRRKIAYDLNVSPASVSQYLRRVNLSIGKPEPVYKASGAPMVSCVLETDHEGWIQKIREA